MYGRQMNRNASVQTARSTTSALKWKNITQSAPFLSARISAGDRQVIADDARKGDCSNGEDCPDEAVRLSSPADRLC